MVDTLDGMDKDSDAEQFLLSLAELSHLRPSQIKLIITSLPVAIVAKHWRVAKSLYIRFEEQMVEVDITTLRTLLMLRLHWGTRGFSSCSRGSET